MIKCISTTVIFLAAYLLQGIQCKAGEYGKVGYIHYLKNSSSFQYDSSDTVHFENDSSVCVMSGIFTVGDSDSIPKDGLITVRLSETDQLVGQYKPNLKTGKYLLILSEGKSYTVTFEVDGFIMRKENLIVPVGTRYRKIYKNINLGKL